MARPSKAALEGARQLAALSDLELGLRLKEWAQRQVQAVRKQLDEAGEDWLSHVYAHPNGDTYERFLNRAVASEAETLEFVATYLAATGYPQQAGQLLRRCPAMMRVVTEGRQDTGRKRGRKTVASRAEAKRAEWSRVGTAIRQKETGEPMSDDALAGRIADRCRKTVGGAKGSIRVALPGLGLDRKSWLEKKPVKSRARKKTNRKFRSYGTLHR